MKSNRFNDLNQNTTGLCSGAMTVLGSANITNGIIVVNGAIAALRVASDGHGIFAATNLSLTEGSNMYAAIITDPFGRSATSQVSVIAQNRGYSYDLNGNLTNDGQFAYSWDDADRLSSARSLLSGQTVLTCAYDGLSRRRIRVMEGVTNRYVYDNWNVVAVFNGNDNVLETYMHGSDLSGTIGGAGGIGGILSTWSSDSGALNYFNYDGLGNVVSVSDSNQAVVATYEYSPFGQVLIKTGTFESRYQFSSKEYDNTVNLNYYGYRFYSSSLGRWLSRDPIGEKGFTPLRPDKQKEELRYREFISTIRRANPQLASRLEARHIRRLGNPTMLREQENLYGFVDNNPLLKYDAVGLACGSGITDKIIPDKPGGFDFTSCCENHDNCYGDCKNKTSKSSCDQNFWQCMLDKCIDDYAGSLGCSELANLYYGTVNNHGQGPFDNARKCCP